MWRCGDVAMWRCGDVAMWRCGDVAMWRCGDVAMWRCGDVAVSYRIAYPMREDAFRVRLDRWRQEAEGDERSKTGLSPKVLDEHLAELEHRVSRQWSDYIAFLVWVKMNVEIDSH
jgi:hypothetical protein